MEINDIINGVKYINNAEPVFCKNGKKRKRALFKCVCGNLFISRVDQVVSGNTTSCGCIRLQNLRKSLYIEYKKGELINGTKYVKEDGFNGAKRMAIFECNFCGIEFRCSISGIKNGHAKSCGCNNIRAFKHGKAYEPEYNIWAKIKDRCLNPKNKKYYNYGGRGIKVCDRWLDFQLFFEDMGKRPTSKHSIDRVDVNGNYEPANCRWATPKEQNRNRRDTVYVYIGGIKTPLVELIEKSGIKDKTVRDRHKRGVPIEQLFLPVKKSVQIN